MKKEKAEEVGGVVSFKNWEGNGIKIGVWRAFVRNSLFRFLWLRDNYIMNTASKIKFGSAS